MDEASTFQPQKTFLLKVKLFLGRIPVHLIIIAVLGLLVYSNTFDNPLEFDDASFIRENPLIKDVAFFTGVSSVEDFDQRNLEGPLTKSIFRRRFLSFLTFALNYRVNGLDVTGYHIANISIHLLNALFLYLLVTFTFRTPRMAGSAGTTARWVALFSALLFVSHPLQTQAVNYITQRFALLAAFFYLLSLTAYVRSRLASDNAVRLPLYAISLAAAACGMISKENVFTLPVVIALYEFFFFEGPAPRRMTRLLPFMLTMLIIPYMLLSGEPDIDRALRTTSTTYSRWGYLLTQFSVIVTYIRLFLLPVNQNLDYDYSLYGSFLEPRVFLSFLFLLSIFFLACWLYLRARKGERALGLVSFGVLWFFITVSVESSIVPTMNLIFEHRAYLPSAGVFMAIGAFLLSGRLRKRKELAVSSLVLVILVLSIAAYARNGVWRSEISLWEDVVSKSPGKARGHINLGISYKSAGLTEKAIEQYNAALRSNQNSARAHFELGNAYKSKGLTEKAIAHYIVAVGLEPDDMNVHNNLGTAYASKKLFDKAIEHFKAALNHNAHDYEINYNLGLAYLKKGLIDRAVESFQNAVKINPDFADAHYDLGLAYLAKGNKVKAQEEVEIALQIEPELYKSRQISNGTTKPE
jgi:tetratricopeptide (TPR) repeat protein